MAQRRQSNIGSTHFPRSDFKDKTIIHCSVEIHNIRQDKFVPILIVVLILIPDFLNYYAVLRCVDVESAQASS
jgi:hypothetical protein